MNTADVLHYGNQTVAGALEGLDHERWYREGVCGIWSVKDIIAHLTSFELMLVELLQSLLEEAGEKPTLEAWLTLTHQEFNDQQVAQRAAMTPAQVWAEYQAAYGQVQPLLARIPMETRRTNGLLAWYGAEYDLEDFLVYSFYGHKREHMAQVNVYRDTLA